MKTARDQFRWRKRKPAPRAILPADRFDKFKKEYLL